MESLLRLATIFKVLDLYAHNAHHFTKGPTFFQDHGFFRELYSFADSKFDSVIERYIGLGGKNYDLAAFMVDVNESLKITDPKFFTTSLILLEQAKKHIELMSKDTTLSQGTINLIVGIEDEIEVLCYKIKQRI